MKTAFEKMRANRAQRSATRDATDKLLCAENNLALIFGAEPKCMDASNYKAAHEAWETLAARREARADVHRAYWKSHRWEAP